MSAKQAPSVAAPPGSVSDLAELYAAHTEATRRHLRRFGVKEQDLDDLQQEVFMVLHAKRSQLWTLEPLDGWLREVCRRVAAGDRRRAHRRREIAFGDPPETAEPVSFEQALEAGEEEERLHRALGQLDEQSRDLLALHELGDLPLVNVAELTRADRKTVRKRLTTALKRLTTLLRSDHSPRAVEAAAPRASPSSEPLRSSDSFRVLAVHPALRVGLVGSVVITIWPGPATLEALELLELQLSRALAVCGTGFGYLAVVEATTRPPDLPARQKIVAMLQAHASHIRVYATAIEGGAAWIVRPVMTGLAFLARPPFPMQFFNGLPGAARWLAERHPDLCHTSTEVLVQSAEQLRRA